MALINLHCKYTVICTWKSRFCGRRLYLARRVHNSRESSPEPRNSARRALSHHLHSDFPNLEIVLVLTFFLIVSFGANCVAAKLVSWVHPAGPIELGAQSTPPRALFWSSTQKVRKIGKPNQVVCSFSAKLLHVKLTPLACPPG